MGVEPLELEADDRAGRHACSELTVSCARRRGRPLRRARPGMPHRPATPLASAHRRTGTYPPARRSPCRRAPP